jgi:hypothetical protein
MNAYKPMSMVRNKTNKNIQDEYFGNSAKLLWKFLSQCKQRKTVDDCCDFYSNIF